MAKSTTRGLLKEILSGDIERVYINISNKAVEWAIAGFIDEANSLLEQLWKFNIPHSGHLWLPDEGLQVLWELSDKRPSGIPFKFKNIVEIEQENWSSVFYSFGDEEDRNKILSKSFTEINDDELFFKAINAGYYNSETPDDILEALKKFVKSERAVGYTYFHATSCGALLAARNNLHKQAKYFIKLWGEGYLKYSGNYMLAYLMRDMKTAKYLLKGLLASTFNLTQEICKNEEQEILIKLKQRMDVGRSLVYNNLSWKQLLNEISRLAIKQKTIDFSEEVLRKKSLAKASATSNEIIATEKRLNIILPDDYKKFLLTSNGFESFSNTGVTLTAVNKVDFFVNVDKQVVDIWTESMAGIDKTFNGKLQSSLIIGGLNEEQQLLLIPLKDADWECWYFSNWLPGEVIYQSFRFYIEEELQRLEDSFYVE